MLPIKLLLSFMVKHVTPENVTQFIHVMRELIKLIELMAQTKQASLVIPDNLLKELPK